MAIDKPYSKKYETISIGAQNTFTDPITVADDSTTDISIGGDGVGTVTIQRKFGTDGDDSDWKDVSSWTNELAEVSYQAGSTQELRIGVKTGDYTSGTFDLILAGE